MYVGMVLYVPPTSVELLRGTYVIAANPINMSYVFQYFLVNGSSTYSSNPVSLAFTGDSYIQAFYGPPPLINIDTTGNNLLWQYLFVGDFIGFIFACYTSIMGEIFFAWIATMIGAAVYIRLKNLAVMGIIWILVGTILIPAMPVVSPLAIFLLVIGIATVLYKLFQHTT
jgi:hypothetical protein